MNLSKQDLQRLYHYALSLTKHPDDAYDLLQTSLKKHLQKSTDINNNIAYIRQIIRHQFIDDCRHNNKIGFDSLEDKQLSLVTEQSLEQQMIDRNHIELLMNNMSTSERETLYLWAVMGYTAAEIANETKEARGTILSRLYRIKQKAHAFNPSANNVGGQ